jgi:hypothetical protein
MVGVSLNWPRFIDGSMDTSDEAIAAHFLQAPLTSFYWPSLLLGYLCILLLLRNLRRQTRLAFSLSAFVGGAVGYFSVDTLMNVLIFKPARQKSRICVVKTGAISQGVPRQSSTAKREHCTLHRWLDR